MKLLADPNFPSKRKTWPNPITGVSNPIFPVHILPLLGALLLIDTFSALLLKEIVAVYYLDFSYKTQDCMFDCHNCRLEFLVAQYDSDKKNKLEKWETWKVKIRSILAFNQTRLDDLKTEGPATDPSKVEEQVVKAKVSDNNFEF